MGRDPWPGTAPQGRRSDPQQFVTTPAGRLGPGINLWIGVDFRWIVHTYLQGCSCFGRSDGTKRTASPIPKVNKLLFRCILSST